MIFFSVAKNVRQFLSEVTNNNPHATRISAVHSYTVTNISAKDRQGRKRKLPDLLVKCANEQATSTNIQQIYKDGVFDYASAVLNDGLELRDTIHEGDGPRIICCWKFMTLYWWHAGHTKY